MSSYEYTGWLEYFKKRPYGWREDFRTSLIMQTTYQGKSKLKVNDYFPSLAIMQENNKNHVQKAKTFIDILQSKAVGSSDRINTKD
jgi:hypothetical protein